MQFYSIQIVQGSEKSNISSCRSFKVNVFDPKVKYFNSFRLEHLPSPSVRGMKEDKSWYFPGILEVGICKVLKRRYLFVLFCFVFLPELPRAADQNVCKQSWAAQAELCYRKCLFPAKTEITASRPFICLHIPTSKIPALQTHIFHTPPYLLLTRYDTLCTYQIYRHHMTKKWDC